MFVDDIRHAAARQSTARALRRMTLDWKRLLSEKGELGGMALARDLINRLETLGDSELDGFFDYLARDLSPDPQAVLRAAQAYAETPGAATLAALTQVSEPQRQELFRRLNRMPGGTAAVLRMKRVDWQSPAELLEKIIHHEAVHAIDGWDHLRRSLQPDRRCLAFFHPALPDLKKAQLSDPQAARESLRTRCGGDLSALQGMSVHETLGEAGTAELRLLCAAYLACASTTAAGNPVARFHLDKGARLERLNPRGNMSAKGLRQSLGLMVNYLYDPNKVEASHAKFREGEVVRSRAIELKLP